MPLKRNEIGGKWMTDEPQCDPRRVNVGHDFDRHKTRAANTKLEPSYLR
jgi:hypothetical protein